MQYTAFVCFPCSDFIIMYDKKNIHSLIKDKLDDSSFNVFVIKKIYKLKARSCNTARPPKDVVCRSPPE